MESARYLVRSVVFEQRSVRAVAAQHGVSKTWLYELVARYKAGGDDALEPRSKRPKSSPKRISAALEDEIVQLRKTLAEEGFDAGAVTIQAHLERRHGKAPGRLQYLAGAQPPRVCEPATPEAAQELLCPLRG
jgi:transposase